MSHGHSVIRHRHLLALCLFHPRHHHLTVEHASTAMYDEIVGGEIVGEVAARHNIDGEGLTNSSAQQPGQFHPANVLTDGSMGAGFGDEHPRLTCEAVDGPGALSEIFDVALLCGEENGEGGQPALLWRHSPHPSQGLRVGDDEAGHLGQPFQRCHDFLWLAGHDGAMPLQELTDGLLLGQDEAPPRGLAVLWHDEHHEIAILCPALRDGHIDSLR